MSVLTDDADAQREHAELQATLRRTQRQLAEAKRRSADLVAAIYEGARDAALIVGKPAPVKAPAKDRRRGHPEEALVHFSDWQLGKRTESYDTDVCIERVRYVVDKVRRITDLQRKDHPIPRVTVMFGGDHIEGNNIFPGQAYEVDSTSYAQLMAASSLMAEVVLSLLEDFDHVTVKTVPGNHGRLGRRGEMPRHDNMDNIAYAIARSHLANQKRLTWDENLRWWDHVQIGNYKAILVHGDQVRGWGGGSTPINGLVKKATSWAAGGGPKVEWSDIYIGHYHQNIVATLPSGGQLRMVPSTESDSEYAAEQMAAAGRPGQRLLFVHPEKAIVTGEYMVWL